MISQETTKNNMFWATAAGIYVVNCKAFLLFDGNTSQQMAKNPNEFMKGVGLGECWCSWHNNGVLGFLSLWWGGTNSSVW